LHTFSQAHLSVFTDPTQNDGEYLD